MQRSARLQDIVRNGYKLRAQCPACGHRADLDVGSIARWYGERTSLADLKRRLICKRCGGRACSLQVAVEW